MKIKYTLITIILFICMTPDVYAYCSQSDILRAKGEANNITLEVKRLKDANGKYTGKYNLVFNNVDEDLYLQDKFTKIKYNYGIIDDEMIENNIMDDEEIDESEIEIVEEIMAENGILTIKDVEGRNIEFNVYYRTCDSEFMRSIKIDLPKYNAYADNPLCEGISEEEIEMCGSWYQGEVTEETLKEKVEEYKEKLKQQEIEQEKNDTTINKIKDFLLKYYIYIIVAIVLIVITTIIITIRKKQYSLD